MPGSQERVRSSELRSPGTRSEAGAAQQVEEETVRRMDWIYGILGEKEIYRRLGDTGYIQGTCRSSGGGEGQEDTEEH